MVTGSPRLALTIGTDTRYAEHWGTGQSGSKGYLGFRYVVQASDRDDDGIVTGNPGLVLQIGDQAREADLYQMAGTGRADFQSLARLRLRPTRHVGLGVC